MKKIILNNKKCTGCLACSDVCEKKAILIEEDKEGFWFPKIIEEKCINCTLCSKICPLNNEEQKQQLCKTYAVQNKSIKDVVNSSSGGIFTLLAKNIITNYHGIVVGASYNEDGKVFHTIVSSINELPKLQKSKYVQSCTKGVYREVKTLLKQDKYVLFVGTPCQIAGLKNYLIEEYKKLICIDFICHGVPSPGLWRDYIEQFGKINSIDFRNKETSWQSYKIVIQGENKDFNNFHYKNPYMTAFLKNYSIRESCFECSFKTPYSQSDLTLGDFWGINNIIKSNENILVDKGVSFVQLNTDNGLSIFNEIINEINYFEVDNNINKKYNTAQFESVNRPKERAVFFKKIYNTKKRLKLRKMNKFVKDALIYRIMRRLWK